MSSLCSVGEVESGDHRLQSVAEVKNGASSKSQMSRGNFLRKACFALLTALILMTMWAATTNAQIIYNGDSLPLEQGVEYTISLKVMQLSYFYGYVPTEAGYVKWASTGEIKKESARVGCKEKKLLQVFIWFTNKGEKTAMVDFTPEEGYKLDCSLHYGDNQTAGLGGFVFPGAGTGNENLMITSWVGNLHFKLEPEKKTWIVLKYCIPDDISEVTFKIKNTTPITVKIPKE